MSDRRELGQGSFGKVEYARYNPTGGSQGNRGQVEGKSSVEVVLKRPVDVSGYENEFAKEARLLQHVKGQAHIVEFLGVATKPHYAIMQEYIEFSFAMFEDDKVVNSLADFLIHIDENYECDGFEHILPLVNYQIVQGVSYLHSNDIAHRDLKPANILVSNQHYSRLSKEDATREWQGERPIVCKLTDFGESRSSLIQTNTLLSSRVTKVDRGSPAYMAPEILLHEKRPGSVTLADLKMFDVWAVGMISFVLANPSCKYPYAQEIESAMHKRIGENPRELLEHLMRSQKLPSPAEKYLEHQSTYWACIAKVHTSCICFDIHKRIKSIGEIEEQIKADSKSRAEVNQNGGIKITRM